MKKLVSFLFSIVVICLASSCNKENTGQNSWNNEHIKSISANGELRHRYLYDDAGKIVEENAQIHYKRYIYDENDRLVKVESTFNFSSVLSSFISPGQFNTELMSSKNSEMNNYHLYEYDNEGRLSKIEFYSNMIPPYPKEEFELRSMRTFEYEDSLIIRVNMADNTGHVNQYYVYAYDTYGNVINEKYYSNIFSPDELISETSYKYDKYKNPFHIFHMTGYPGLNSNVNNIIETSSISYYDLTATGVDKYHTGKFSYYYNKDGYPVKAFEEGGEFDYLY